MPADLYTVWIILIEGLIYLRDFHARSNRTDQIDVPIGIGTGRSSLAIWIGDGQGIMTSVVGR